MATEKQLPPSPNGCIGWIYGLCRFFDATRIKRKRQGSGTTKSGAFISIVHTELKNGRNEVEIYYQKPPGK